MTDINSINLGKIRITNKDLGLKKAKEEEKEETPTASAQTESKNVSSEEVFGYLANTALVNKANIKKSPTAIVNKYNSPEAIARITAMMGEFEAGVVAGLAKFEEEMGAAPAYKNLSEADKLALSAGLLASDTTSVGV